MDKKIGILFDLDGTLLDTLEDLTDAVNYTLGKFDIPERTTGQIRSILGNGTRNLITLAIGGGEADPRIEEALSIYKPYYEAHCQIKTKPYDGIPEAVEALSRKYTVAVVSNKPHFAVKPMCDNFFPGVYCRGESAECPRKPAPDMVYKTMADLGVEKCVYIGDSEVDVQTARNAGVPCVSVLWGFRDKPELEEAGGKYFCENPRQLTALVESIAKEIGC